MKSWLLAATALAATSFQAHAYTIDQFDRFATLPATYAPTAISTSPRTTYIENVSSAKGTRPVFLGTSYAGEKYDAVAYGTASFAATSFGQSNGALGTFAFIFGSPDSYNSLSFSLAGKTVLSLSGKDFGATPGTGYYLTRLSDIGAYDTVTFGSRSSSFEFAALSPVPLPAAAPLFGAALLALGMFGYGASRKKAATAAA